MVYFRTIDNRPVLSYIDPNYSGFILFLFFCFLQKVGYHKLSIVIICLGLFTLSRNFILAVAIYFLFHKIHLLKKITIRFNFLFLFLLLNIVVLAFSAFFIANISLEEAYSNTSRTRSLGGLTTFNEAL